MLSALGTAHRNRAHVTTLANPYYPNLPAKLPALSEDFHLDTFFNPVWMSGPNVFSFAKDGKVVRPKTFRPDPYPGYFARQPLRLTSRLMIDQRGVVSTSDETTAQRVNTAATRSYPNAVNALPSNDFYDIEKPWKNVAITEQDDAEFEVIKAAALERKEKEKQQLKFQLELERKKHAAEAKLVYAWPPALPAQSQTDMLSEEYGGVSGDENETPELSYLVSPDTSQASEPEESPLIPTPEKRGDHFPFGVLHEKTVSLEEEPLEKVVGFERLRRKAPPPLHLEGSEDIDEDDSGCFLFNNVCGMNEGADGMMEKRVLSPLTAGIPVHSKLSATLLRA